MVSLLPYINVHQLPGSPPSGTPSPLPPHPTPPLWVVTELRFEFPESHSKFPLAVYFTHDNVCFQASLSVLLTLSFLPTLPVSISLFSISVSLVQGLYVKLACLLIMCRPGGGHLPSNSSETKARWGHTEGVAAQLQGEGLKHILLEICVQSLSRV